MNVGGTLNAKIHLSAVAGAFAEFMPADLTFKHASILIISVEFVKSEGIQRAN
jgi:hypothetical protein